MRSVNYFDSEPRKSSSVLTTIATVAFLLSPMLLRAQNQRDFPPKNPVPLTTNKAAPDIRSSPFSPRAEGDTLFVVDEDPVGLDTDCKFRNDGPLVIELPVKRYVGAVNPDGTLVDPDGMIAAGFISATAKLRMPAKDIDVNGKPVPEIDEVYFNDTKIGVLSGANNAWKINEFEVPIKLIKFPKPGVSGAPPDPAINTIEIQIDQGNSSTGNEAWCMSLDWVELEFKAIAPIFLVHGTAAQSDTWDPHFTAYFSSKGIPWSNDINLKPNGTILENGKLLSMRLAELANSFGAKKCHIIAHSKGGLDTRAYLNLHYSPETLEVVSVFTLSTPHHGTIISDIIVSARASVGRESRDLAIRALIYGDYFAFRAPKSPAIDNQTTASMAWFNAQFPTVPPGIHFFNYGADADINNSSFIEAGETDDLLPSSLSDDLKFISGSAMYRAIGEASSISVTIGTRPGDYWGTKTFTSIDIANTNSNLEENDLVTSVTSAESPMGTYIATVDANHSSMKSPALASEILLYIITNFSFPF